MLLINLLIITSIVVYVIDLTDFPEYVKTMLVKFRFGEDADPGKFELDKPWNCSTCMSLWICLLYILLFYPLNLYTVASAFLMSYSADMIGGMLLALKDVVILITSKIK